MLNPIQDKLATFFSLGKKLSFTKGEVILRAEENPSGVMYITEGCIKVYVISRKGEEVIINSFKPGSFIPMSWALTSHANHYFYEALTDVELYRRSRIDVLEFLQSNADVLFDLLERVLRGTDGILLRMALLMGEDAYTRLISEIMITAKRFGTTASSGTVTVQITERELAAQTGLTRETVSRELQKIKTKGIISFQKNVLTVLHLEALEVEMSLH